MSRRIFLDGTRLRIDSFEGSEETPGLTILFHADSEELFIVDHAGEENLRIDREAVEARAGQLQDLRRELEQQLAELPPAQREMAERMMAERGLDAPPPAASVPEIQPTAETEEIAGYRCTKHRMVDDGEVVRELWVAPWSELGVEDDSARVLEELAVFVDELMTSFGEGLPLGTALRDRSLANLISYGGFPVLLRNLRNGEIVSEEVLRRVGEASSDVGFEPPEGYRETELDAPTGSDD